jgi:hypothetical protein
MKAIISYLVPIDKEIELPDKFLALACDNSLSWSEVDKLQDELTNYCVEKGIFSAMGPQAKVTEIKNKDGNYLAEW